MVPKIRNGLQKSSGYAELLKQGIIERKMIDKIEVALVLNEKQATVMFPTLKGEADMNHMFSSNDAKSNNNGACFMNGALISLGIVGTIQTLLMNGN